MRIETSRTPRLLACLLVVVALLGLAGPAAAEGEANVPRYPHVVWQEDPAHAATIAWVTQEKGGQHRVHWDIHSKDGQPASYGHTAEATRHIKEYSGNVYFHQAKLEGLHPSATYHFVVESGGQTTEEFYFRTAPADDRPVRLLYGGDSRSNPKSRREVNRLIRRLYTSDDRLLALVHGGDYVNISMRWPQWKGWLEDWKLTIAEDGRMIPVVPARGNHEFSVNNVQGKPDNYNGIWGSPGGPDKDYWTTRIGSQIAFINLNSNSSLGGDQRDWLERELKKHTKSRRWILANYHRPAYPAVKEPGAAKVHWVPLFEKYHVDLVCESDGHVLKRTVPIIDDEYDPNGVVYVGEGGLGVAQRTPDTDRWYLQEPGMATSAHHVQRLTFAGDTLTYEALNLDGEVIDKKRFDKRRWGSPVDLAVRDAELRADGTLEVDFSKGVTAESVGAAENFRISPELNVKSATRHPDFDDRAVLEVGKLDANTTYSVTATGVKDMLGNEIADAAGSAVFGRNLGANPDVGGESADVGPDAGEIDGDTGADAGGGMASGGSGRADETASCSLVSEPTGFGIFLAVVVGLVGVVRRFIGREN